MAKSSQPAPTLDSVCEQLNNLVDANTNSRALTRQIASELVAQRIMPISDQVRKIIVERTGGARNPSSSTIQDELGKWYADTFWPTYGAFMALPDDSTVPAQLQRLFADSFQSVVVGAMQIASSTFDDQREAYDAVIASLNESIAVNDEKKEEQAVKFKEIEDRLAAAMSMILGFETEAAEAKELRRELEQKLRESLEKQVELERQISQVRETERAHAQAQVDAAREDSRRIMLDLDGARQLIKNMTAAAEKNGCGNAADPRKRDPP